MRKVKDEKGCDSRIFIMLFVWFMPFNLFAQTYTHTFDYPLCKTEKTAINVWLPPGAQHVRGALLVMQNTINMRITRYGPMRTVAANHKLAIVYLRCSELIAEVENGTDELQKVMDSIASVTGIEDFRKAPWIGFGLSSVGHWPFFLIFRYPERTIAGVTWHGEVPHFPADSWATITDTRFPYICLVGAREWMDSEIAPAGHWYHFVRPGLLNWRKEGWLTSMVAAYNLGHLDYDVSSHITEDMMLSYMTKYVDRAAGARLPEENYPADDAFSLRDIDPSTGYLLDTCLECLMYMNPERPDTFIQRYEDVPESRRKSMFWTFDKELADDWLYLHTLMHESAVAEGKQTHAERKDITIARTGGNKELSFIITGLAGGAAKAMLYSLRGEMLASANVRGRVARFERIRFPAGACIVRVIRSDGAAAENKILVPR